MSVVKIEEVYEKYLKETKEYLKKEGFEHFQRVRYKNSNTLCPAFVKSIGNNQFLALLFINEKNDNAYVVKPKMVRIDAKDLGGSMPPESYWLNFLNFKFVNPIKALGNIRLKNKFISENIMFNSIKFYNDYLYKEDLTSTPVITLCFVFPIPIKSPSIANRNLVFGIDEVEITVTDVVKLVSTFVAPKDRTVRVNSNVKVIKKNSLGLSYGTKLEVVKLAKSGATTYAFLKNNQTNKELLLPVSKIKVF